MLIPLFHDLTGLNFYQRRHGRFTLLLQQLLLWGVIAAVVYAVFALGLGEAWGKNSKKVEHALGKDGITSKPVYTMIAMGAFSLAPFAVIMFTSFVKLGLVFSMTRGAVGTSNIPPTQVITGLSIILTIYIMAPVGLDIWHNAQKELAKSGITDVSSLNNIKASDAFIFIDEAKEPIRSFLYQQAHPSERKAFLRLAKKMRIGVPGVEVLEDDFMILVPAFLMSELAEAFQIGFLIFLPLVAIDMVVSNLLMALGMQMLSPTVVSLPFKLLLFVMIDGWYLLAKGLVVGYHYV